MNRMVIFYIFFFLLIWLVGLLVTWLICLLWDKWSLCYPGWPQSHDSASASQIAGITKTGHHAKLQVKWQFQYWDFSEDVLMHHSSCPSFVVQFSRTPGTDPRVFSLSCVLVFLFFIFIFFFQIRSPQLTKLLMLGLNPWISCLRLPECWNYGCASPAKKCHLFYVCILIFNQNNLMFLCSTEDCSPQRTAISSAMI